mmetsp:Transcript_33927/g.95446  ORF Transcript_33927/g.95446 Transcript_33927/m.95446 type:complete len:225 (-) Transcript_33927:1225-1899(-)
MDRPPSASRPRRAAVTGRPPPASAGTLGQVVSSHPRRAAVRGRPPPASAGTLGQAVWTDHHPPVAGAVPARGPSTWGSGISGMPSGPGDQPRATAPGPPWRGAPPGESVSSVCPGRGCCRAPGKGAPGPKARMFPSRPWAPGLPRRTVRYPGSAACGNPSNSLRLCVVHLPPSPRLTPSPAARCFVHPRSGGNGRAGSAASRPPPVFVPRSHLFGRLFRAGGVS